MIRFLRLLGLSAVLACMTLPAMAGGTPRERIFELNATLLDTMKNADSLGYAGRYKKLEPVMTAIYDFELMSRVAVGAFWKKLGGEKRDDLIDALKRFSVATYAARFDGYSGEQFKIVSAEKSVRDSRLVKTELIKSDGSPVALNYLMQTRDGDWRVIDVFLDARFSELARMRADYTAVINRKGFDILIETIESRIEAMARE